MKRPSTRDIQSTLSSKLVKRNDKLFILQNDAKDAMGKIMSTFEGVYCGISANKQGQLLFTVQSTKTNRVFVEAIVLGPMETKGE